MSPATLSKNPHVESTSTSFYQDLSHATSGSFSQTNYATGNGTSDITHQQICLTKAMAAIFRFKARKAGSTFWKWKYTPYNIHEEMNKEKLKEESKSNAKHDASM